MPAHSVDLVQNLVQAHRRDGRCVYNKAAKRELVTRCLQPGVSLARMAMDHGVNANLLRKWVMQQTGKPAPRRRQAIAATLPAVSLLQVSVESQPGVAPLGTDGYLELIVAGATIRVHGRIDMQSLSVVLDCLARRA